MLKSGYISAIFSSGWKVWRDSILETVVIASISLIPLFGATLHQILPVGSAVGPAEAFEKAFLKGQLLFYSLGFIATIAWNCNKDFKQFFPLRVVLSLYCFVGVVINSIVIGNDPTLEKTRLGILAPTSIVLFVSSVLFYTFVAVIDKVHVNVGENQAEQDALLSEAVKKSRGIQ